MAGRQAVIDGAAILVTYHTCLAVACLPNLQPSFNQGQRRMGGYRNSNSNGRQVICLIQLTRPWNVTYLDCVCVYGKLQFMLPSCYFAAQVLAGARTRYKTSLENSYWNQEPKPHRLKDITMLTRSAPLPEVALTCTHCLPTKSSKTNLRAVSPFGLIDIPRFI